LRSSIPLGRADSEQLIGSERNPIDFSSVSYVSCDLSLITSPNLIDPSFAISTLSENTNLQKASGLDQSTIKSKLSVAWSADKAVKDCTFAITGTLPRSLSLLKCSTRLGSCLRSDIKIRQRNPLPQNIPSSHEHRQSIISKLG
jgi:hypothetical protein